MPNLAPVAALLRIARRVLESLQCRAYVAYFRAQGMKIGTRSRIGSVKVYGAESISIGEMTNIESGAILKCVGTRRREPRILIGNACFVGSYTIFNCTEEIVLQDHVMIAAGCHLIDRDHGFTTRSIPIGRQKGVCRPIVVGQGAWVGANSVILRGVVIGPGAIIGAGAVVNEDVGPYEIWAGVPARKIGQRPL